MSKSSIFTLANAIRATILFGLFVTAGVVIQSCQKPKTGVDAYAVGTLKSLTQLDAPPPQLTASYKTADGRALKMSDLRGKIVVLNAWGTFCPPCVSEMPTLDALQSARGSNDFEVVTISVDRTAEDAARWMEKNNIDLTPWHDSSYTLTSGLKLPGFPTTIIYDRNGVEIARIAGEADWDAPEVLELVDYLIAR